ncbi:diguanylate cyclase [Porphyromonadaceae bacterium OttesenSCG-928-L07]|nr:diguanylate cyclase [Porphyromonadaceae bacterium OttesenSCG-928-L07]MDL2251459.1 diguanylate cyclase [Odoribacter sp. OttesenSCG-928-J03]MDL2282956.1 diguanylate cyclase [Odoribacter sp. OttesenSCG-928-G04]
MEQSFKNIFEDLFLPVIVCKNSEKWPVAYMNTKAKLLLAPMYSVEEIKKEQQSDIGLDTILRFKTQEEFFALSQRFCKEGHIDDYRTEIMPSGQGVLPVAISGSAISWGKSDDYFVLYLVTGLSEENDKYSREFSSIVASLFFIDNVDSSINTILARAGQTLGVSRAYVFEEISDTTTRNTYEWCAPGVDPAIQDLQELRKDDYNYEVIVNSGMYITDDVSALPEGDREILEMQGIKSLAIVTCYNDKKPLGYVGFDDCEKSRKWDHDEILFLRGISTFISTLIMRRKVDEKMQDSFNVMQLISDSSEKIIYANSLDDYSLLFVNKAMADTLKKRPEELIGRPCYEAIQQKDAPCSFCPIPKIEWHNEQNHSSVYSWEHYNTITKKTYLAKDNIIKWVDGRQAHIETAMDISQRIEHEEQLRYFASTDIMTKVSNREWGSKILTEKLKENSGGSLCFIDIDGLKVTNDQYGHTAGDRLLKETVKIICKEITDDSFVCRWGGDEFLLWMDDEPDKAKEIVERIQERMVEYNGQKKRKFTLSFSYGIVAFNSVKKNTTLDNLVTAADQLMYKNKMKKKGLL